MSQNSLKRLLGSVFVLLFILISKFLLMIIFNVYLFLRERDRMRMGEGQREREGDMESEAGSRL